MRIAKITAAYIRLYSDSGQTTAYVEWIDDKGVTGRTEGAATRKNSCYLGRVSSYSVGPHMDALFQRAKREGITPEFQRW